MVEIPAKVIVPICIEQGSIFHYKLEVINHDGTAYKGDRFLIVLNANPKTDEILVLVTITKQVSHQREYIRRIGEDATTLVQISKSDFSRLSAESIVNCNNTYEKTLGDLIDEIEKGGKIFFDKLPKNIVGSLVCGVLMSKQVPQDHKRLLI